MIIMTDNQIELIKAMEVLELKDGDIVVLKIDSFIYNEQAEVIRSCVERVIDTNKHKILILQGGMDIGVVRSNS